MFHNMSIALSFGMSSAVIGMAMDGFTAGFYIGLVAMLAFVIYKTIKNL